MLYRGERAINQGSLHFTSDKSWVKHFGRAVLQGRLPAGAKIKVITGEDLERAYTAGIMTDNAFYKSIFRDGYDVIIGHDVMDFNILDVVVNPKLLDRFTRMADDSPDQTPS